MTAAPPFSGVLFGAAYYAEYQPAGTLDRDLDLMREAGFTVVRVGESVWSTWEPREGVFDLDWLQPVLDGAHERGIKVIVGTPTYAVPPWLTRLHPEIAVEQPAGHRVGWGARQEAEQTHPAYRFYAERIVRKVVERTAGHPAVIGFQVDNEPGMRLPENEHVFQRFVDWLRARYGTVESLNEEWGLVYWSHRLSDWSDLWRPEGNFQPQYQLEWRRFQSTLATDLIGWEAAIVREYLREDQFVTTCISYSRPQVSDDELVRSLDVTAGNPYYKMQDGLDRNSVARQEDRWWHTSVSALFQWGDRAWSSGQSPYLVTETNAQSIGASWQNHPPFPGQLRQAAFALLSRGGRMIEYWHWHTLHFGAETYWGGVLPHSQRPGRIYREVRELGAALRAIGSRLDGYEPDADALFLYSTDSKWSFEAFPPLATPDGGPDRGAYDRVFDAFYAGFFDAGAQIRIQHDRRFSAESPTDLARRFPVLVAAALSVADDDLLARLVAYAEAGGHLIAGIRTGYSDELARARLAVAPAIIGEPAGVAYDEYSNLSEPLLVHATTGRPFPLEPGAAGTGWVDVLRVADADVLLEFAPTELAAGAALTTRRVGAGRISYLATVPNEPLARSIAVWAVPERAAQHWSASAAVTVATGRTSDRRIAFVSNWSAEPTTVVAPYRVRDVVTGDEYGARTPIPLERRAAVVLEATDGSTEPSGPHRREDA